MTLHAQIDRLDNVTDEGTKQLIVFIFFFCYIYRAAPFCNSRGSYTLYTIYSLVCWIVLFWRYYTDQKKKKNREEKEAAAAAPSKNNSLT